jgi:hypothetical protein
MHFGRIESAIISFTVHGRHKYILIDNQFGILEFLSANFKLENLKPKIFSSHKTSSQLDKRHPVMHDTENMDHGPFVCFYGWLGRHSE